MIKIGSETYIKPMNYFPKISTNINKTESKGTRKKKAEVKM